MADEILSTLLQLIVFSLIPFIVYVFQKKSVAGFTEYIGLVKSNARANYLAYSMVGFVI